MPTGANPFPECLNVLALQVEGLSNLGRIAALAGRCSIRPGRWSSIRLGGSVTSATTRPPLRPRTSARRKRFTRPLPSIAPSREPAAPVLYIESEVLAVSTAGNDADEMVAAAYPGTGLAEYHLAMNVAAAADSEMSFISDVTLWQPICPPGPNPCLLPDLTATPEEVGSGRRSLRSADELRSAGRQRADRR